MTHNNDEHVVMVAFSCICIVHFVVERSEAKGIKPYLLLRNMTPLLLGSNGAVISVIKVTARWSSR